MKKPEVTESELYSYIIFQETSTGLVAFFLSKLNELVNVLSKKNWTFKIQPEKNKTSNVLFSPSFPEICSIFLMELP